MATLFTTIPSSYDGHNFRFYSANNCDANGNRRIIVHFLDFINLEEMNAHRTFEEDYNLACRRAKYAGFKKFNTKEFGGGFICQYDFCHCKDIAERIVSAIENVHDNPSSHV